MLMVLIKFEGQRLKGDVGFVDLPEDYGTGDDAQDGTMDSLLQKLKLLSIFGEISCPPATHGVDLGGDTAGDV